MLMSIYGRLLPSSPVRRDRRHTSQVTVRSPTARLEMLVSSLTLPLPTRSRTNHTGRRLTQCCPGCPCQNPCATCGGGYGGGYGASYGGYGITATPFNPFVGPIITTPFGGASVTTIRPTPLNPFIGPVVTTRRVFGR
jgi:hypothetical protein